MKHGQEILNVQVAEGTKNSLYAMGKHIARITHCNDLSASQVARMALQRGMEVLEREYPRAS